MYLVWFRALFYRLGPVSASCQASDRARLRLGQPQRIIHGNRPPTHVRVQRAWTTIEADSGAMEQREVENSAMVPNRIRKASLPHSLIALTVCSVVGASYTANSFCVVKAGVEKARDGVAQEGTNAKGPSDLQKLQASAWDTLRRGNYTEAEELFRQLVSSLARTREHEQVLAYCHEGLAWALVLTGKADQALISANASLKLREGPPVASPPEIARSLRVLGRIEVARANCNLAQQYFMRAAAIWERESGPNSLEIAPCLNGIAEALRAYGRYEQALPLYKRAIEIVTKVDGDDSPLLADALNGLADSYCHTLKYELAEASAKKALTLVPKQA